MTYEDFLNKFEKRNIFDKYWNYFICISIIAIGIFFISKFLFADWNQIKTTTKDYFPKWSFIIFMSLLISLGLYGFWRIPKSYQITSIRSDFSILKKNEILNQIIKDFKLNELERNKQYTHFKYVGRFWNSFDIYIFLDAENFYLNAQQIDFGNDGGFIDFGTSKKVTHKIKSKILSYL
ncbi:MAG: hypothetical protein IPP30_04465 [Flavobacterium sp.]|nr:hypothetical protein [Flavobacterium sp.]